MTVPGWRKMARLSAGVGRSIRLDFERHLVGDFEDGQDL